MSGVYIKRVIIHGFKSYEETTTIGPFSPGMNSIVGLNGSGKSNFYNAIEFVLLDEYENLRPSTKKSLLHEGTGTSSPTAFVEIVFANESRSIPIDKDDVSIRRSISLQKDEYFIDRKHSTRQDVRSILESCGFSPANGYYIIKQGRVAVLATMSDAERLGLLLDIAGVRVYDNQRLESMKMIAESESRNQKIEDSLRYIEGKLKTLENEKSELEQFNELDKKRRAVEILIQDRRIKENQNEIEARYEEKDGELSTLEDLRSQLQEKDAVVRNISDQTSKSKVTEKICLQEQSNLAAQETSIIKQHERAQLKVQKYEQKFHTADMEIQSKEIKLADVEREIEELTRQETEIQGRADEINKKRAGIDGRLGAIQELCNGAGIEDIESLQAELDHVSRSISKYEEEKASIQREADKTANGLSELEKTKIGKKQAVRNLETKQKDIYLQKKESLDSRKVAWVQQSKYEKEIKNMEQVIDQLQIKMERLVPSEVSRGIDYLKSHKIEGVLGVIIDLIDQVDENAAQAAYAVAKSKLFYVLVDTVGNAAKVNEAIRKRPGCGIATFILEKIKPNHKSLPPGVDSLISHIRFDKKYHSVMEFIFGGIALAGNLSQANDLSDKYGVNCVTEDGDFVAAHGMMTGGSASSKKSPLLTSKIITTYKDKVNELRKKLLEIEENIKQIHHTIKECDQNSQGIEKEISITNQEEEVLKVQIHEARAKLDQINATLFQKENEISELQSHSMTLKQRLDTMNSLAGQVDDKIREEALTLREKRKKIDTRRLELIQTRTNIRNRLKNYLIPQQRKLTDQISDLDSSRIQSRLLQEQNKLKQSDISLEKLHELIANNTKKLSEVTTKLASLIDQHDQINQERQNLLKKITSHQGKLDRILSRISVLEKGREELKSENKDLGPYPEEEIVEFENLSATQLYNQLHDINESLKEYRYVNKKALEQHQSFSTQRDELEKRRSDLTTSSESIKNLIASLDERKAEAIEHTFAQISDNFARIFDELVPGGNGVLSLIKDPPEKPNEAPNAVGIGILVQFGSEMVDSLTITQLSGGQRSLVALALVFAIQKFSPAPFYLLDEIDSALDPQHREAVTNMIANLSRPESGQSAQFILTSFKRELIDSCEKYYAIKSEKGHSIAKEISHEDAISIIQERNEAQE